MVYVVLALGGRAVLSEGGEQIVVRSHMRFAAGGCLIAAGLVMGCPGAAIAVADTPSSDSAAQGHSGSDASAQVSAMAGSLVGHVTDSLRETIRGVTSSLGSGRQPGQHPSTGTSPTKEPASTGTSTRPVAAAPNALAPVTDVTAPVSQVAPVTDVTAPVSQVAPVSDVTAAVAPVAEVAAPVAEVAAPVTQVLAPVANVVAPVSDVIVAVQDVLTSVASSVVPLIQVPADLFSLLMPGILMPGMTGMEPVATGSALSDGAALSPTAGGDAVAWQSPLVSLAGVRSMPAADENTAAVAPVDVIAGFAVDSHMVSSPPETAPPSSNGAGPKSFFRDVFGKIPLPVAATLAALAAAALPGLGGLLTLNAAGIRIGYRQAKFGFAVQTSGIARFARPGPIGVVRSGSLVFIRPKASSDGNLVDNAA